VNIVIQKTSLFLHFSCSAITNISISVQTSGMGAVLVVFGVGSLTLRLLMSYIYGAPSKARNANVVYIWTYVWQR